MKFFFGKKLSIKKQSFFAKKLSFLVKSGLPTLESMEVIKTQAQSKAETILYEKVILDLTSGHTLAHSLAEHKNIFNSFTINLIRAGEASGTLTENLLYLADELKKKQGLKRKITSALLYPVIITISTCGITGFLILYIFPKIMPVFRSLHKELPVTTRFIIFISDALKHYGIYILLLLLLALVGSYFLLKNKPKIRFLFDGILLRIPLIGKINTHYHITNISRTLGLLLKSGSPLSDALVITKETTENTQYQKALDKILIIVNEGKNMSEGIRQFPQIFPEMLCHMVAIGETSGNLPETLIYLSQFYENEFEDLTKDLSSAIEPALMLVMGVIVGFVAISVITPIYEITNNLKM